MSQGIRYRDLIETYFLIDEPKTGQLVPFKFRPVQNKFYDELVAAGLEKHGIEAALRFIILKARREGFSSLILALFAADDLTQENPTESLVISYRDDATDTFRKRYRNFVLSCYARKKGFTVEQIQANPGILDGVAKEMLSVDGTDLEIRQNKAHFYCGTASSRVAGRGGVLQKLLFSEAAFYPDVEKLTAREIIDGTLRQVDIASGWAFIESTANGYGNYYEMIWSLAAKGEHRFKSCFYGWEEFYTPTEFELIASEFADKQMLRQEYPKTPDEAFIASGSSYFDNEKIMGYLDKALEPLETGQIELLSTKKPHYTLDAKGPLKVYEFPTEFHAYTIGGDVAEGIEGGDYSVLYVIDNKSLRCVAKFRAHLSPDSFATVAFALGIFYNEAYLGIEVNKDGLWVNTELFKMGYPNLYYREAIDDITNRVTSKVGFRTDERTRPYILSELQKMLARHNDIWLDKDFLQECLTFVRNRNGRPEAMLGKNDDIVFACAIGYEIRRNAPVEFEHENDKQPKESYVARRLNELYGRRKQQSVLIQEDYL